ncbi:hypothetical protein AWM70_08550 [Paenibacillus yonginensis]|uniref:Uncharacterized protein n=1 Tax=Paenibacillus yonginensis TaxID=1462996 RepID=A0A1B1MZP1_9BACL|nr:hypothetical protein [Paenibacillus yonginensis]ANS74628.1 hypothetical protein AWM70_08550 [Paenibacillus yonginensis]
MEFSSIKSMLWTAVGLSLFVAACTVMTRSVQLSEDAFRATASVYSNQALNVYTDREGGNGGNTDGDSVSVFNGAQVIYMWRNSLLEKVVIIVNGEIFPVPEPYPDPEWTAPANRIRLDRLYTAVYRYDDHNQLKEISFTEQ